MTRQGPPPLGALSIYACPDKEGDAWGSLEAASGQVVYTRTGCPHMSDFTRVGG